MIDAIPVTAQVVQAVEEYVCSELSDAAKYENRTPSTNPASGRCTGSRHASTKWDTTRANGSNRNATDMRHNGNGRQRDQ